MAPVTPKVRITEHPAYLIRRAQGVLHTALAEALREHGATIPQYAVLTFLDEEPGLSNADLARGAFLTPQTMNQTLRSLEAMRWVTRRPHPVHGRILQASLTQEGRTVLLACRAATDAIEEQMLAGLSPDDRRRLEAALRSCIDALT